MTKRISMKIAAVATGLLAGAGTAAAVVGVGKSEFEAAAHWTWPENVPGKPSALPHGDFVDPAEAIDLSTLRTVASVTGQDGAAVLLAAARKGGGTCLTAAYSGMRRGFQCLHKGLDVVPVIYFQTVGGSRPDVVDQATLLGVVRPDVERVVVELADGSSRALTLNGWRAFGYSASAAEGVPAALVAYDAGGREVERLNLAVRPPE